MNKMYIVCWVTKEPQIPNYPFLDHYQPFVEGNTEENYKDAKELYESLVYDVGVYSCNLTEIIESTDYGSEGDKNNPYLFEQKIEIERKYNPEYGDEKICECGHSYYRHFDTYEKMEACGCKYCACDNFKLKEK